MQDLLFQLKKYGKSNIYPFHMPGHKRRVKGNGLNNFYNIDITEVEGFDDLHHATGILLEAEQRAAKTYKSDCTHFLVNGSTSGILSAIFATTSQKGKILLSRNSHKAAYHALFLRQLEASYVYPEYLPAFEINGAVLPREIEEKLKKDPQVEAVYITSPTAEGVVSDIYEIAKICHQYGKPLIVDEAHGAHFGFSDSFPETSIVLGADIVIASVHKTLPSFTQTALIHINGNRVKKETVEEYLSIFQTSSPSYILMGGIDHCMEILDRDADKLFQKFLKNIEYFHRKTKDLQVIQILQEKDMKGTAIKNLDPGKLVISIKHTNKNGAWLQKKLLDQYELQMEMAAPSFVLAIVTIMDQKKGFRRLQKALLEIDKQLVEETLQKKERKVLKQEQTIQIFQDVEVVYSCDKAKTAIKRKALFLAAAGMVSAEFVILYPPGIPLIVPGERMNENMILQITKYRKQGLSIQGMKDKLGQYIEVVAE